VKYQPGSRSEKTALLNHIQSPELCWKEEKALITLKLWKRRIECAKELQVTIPDPCILLAALDAITSKAIQSDQRKVFRLNTAREAIGVDVSTTEEAVNKLTLLLGGELEESVASTWSTITPKVKSIKGNPKGDKGKGGKDGKGETGKSGKEGKGKDKSKDPCYFFTETEDGCNKGQLRTRYHRLLKPEEKRCYVCGSTKHMAGECDKPKKGDAPPKETPKDDKGKTAKGKPKGKNDEGKGKPPVIKPIGEVAETSPSERTLRKEDSDPKEPEMEPQKLNDLERKVIKAMRERSSGSTSQAAFEDLD
jgi:hypothetical protein